MKLKYAIIIILFIIIIFTINSKIKRIIINYIPDKTSNSKINNYIPDKIDNYTILCFENEYIVLIEYIKSVFSKNKIIVYNIDTKFNIGNYISLRRIPILSDSLKLPMPITIKSYYSIASPYLPNNSNVIFLNVDHLTNHNTLSFIKTYLNPKIKYYDFSENNIKIFGKGVYIPYKENIEETLKLKSFMNVKKIYDICVVGEKSKRRYNIITELIKQYSVIYIHNLYGDERDSLIGKSKLLLNIHSNLYRKCYESIRCERWRFAKMPIISEICNDVLPNDIIGCSYNQLIETCTKWMDNYQKNNFKEIISKK